ncbi:MAG: amino acid ABC transporter permease [Actinomycetota bacterium]|nr:amino acid ABC transporter permease [Actinomycetota bacterium]
MSSTVLAEDLGPIGRRRVRLATAVAVVVLGSAFAGAVSRLASSGQLAPSRWRPLFSFDVLGSFAQGLLSTLRAALLAGMLALVVGGVLALSRLARAGLPRWAAGAYVEFYRSLPLLTLIIFSYFGLPMLGVDFDSALPYLVIALTAYNAAMLAEIFRAGILSLERGQSEAAYAIGLTYWQATFLVVIPQATRRMVPAIVSQLVTLLKDTSLGAIIGYQELVRAGQFTGVFYDNPLQAFTLVALIFVAVNYGLGRFATALERRQARRYRAEGIHVPGGPEDLVLTQERARMSPKD